MTAGTVHPPSAAHREIVGVTPDERPKIPPRPVVQEYLTLARLALEEVRHPVVPQRRERRDEKAHRLIASGSVVVLEVDPARALVFSAGNKYRVRWDHGPGWGCTCANPAGTCSHISAVKRMTTARGAA